MKETTLKQTRIIITALLLAPLAVVAATNELTVAGVFTDHAVLQRGVPVPVWGWAEPGEQVTVEFAGQTKTATADAKGKWLVTLDAMPACAVPGKLKISRALNPDPSAGGVSAKVEPLSLSDILVGDVWLCSGQSNMALCMLHVTGSYPALKEKLEKAGNPQLRLCSVPFSSPAEPLSDVSCAWQAADPASANLFSAIGYLFGERLQRELGVPVGIINASRGGTWIENWLTRELVETMPSCKDYIEGYRKGKVTRAPDSQNGPGLLFNGMIAPLVPYALKGVLWYQGEGNVWEFTTYHQKIATLINTWRGLWKQPDLPFFMSELAPLGKYSPTPQDTARCRFGVDLATGAKDAGHAWTITITDGGEQEDIHPRYKDIPAERFAALALAKVYNKQGVCHGPVLKSWKAESGKALLTFDSTGRGLEARTMTLDGHQLSANTLAGFELGDKEMRFFRAKAEVQGLDTVVVSCPEVPEPVAVRYAWADFPLCNLYNREGFAAYPFRTDDWPWMTPKAP